MIKIELQPGQDYLGNLKRELELSGARAVNDISKIIKSDIEVNIAHGRSIYGGDVKPNKAGTRVLFKTGELFRSVRNEKSGKDRFIFLDGSRAQIGSWLQYGTSKMAARAFFGFARTTLEKIDRYLKNG